MQSTSIEKRRQNESIEKDIEKRRAAYVQKQIVEQVKSKGGWPRDYAKLAEKKSPKLSMFKSTSSTSSTKQRLQD